MRGRDIAAASGFGAVSHFSHAFRVFCDRRRSDDRGAGPESEAAPSWPGTLSDYLQSQARKAQGQHGQSDAQSDQRTGAIDPRRRV